MIPRTSKTTCILTTSRKLLRSRAQRIVGAQAPFATTTTTTAATVSRYGTTTTRFFANANNDSDGALAETSSYLFNNPFRQAYNPHHGARSKSTMASAIVEVPDAPAITPTTTTTTHVRILYATTGGTAQLFAMQLADALQEQLDDTTAKLTVEFESLSEYKSLQQLMSAPPPGSSSNESNSNDTLHLFIVSTAGVGEPPAPVKAFYEDLQTATAGNNNSVFRYAVFGLGNQTAHPNHYNVVGKTIQSRLGKLLNRPSVLPLALGNDGDCIDDDFDKWQEQVVEFLQQEKKRNDDPPSSDSDARHGGGMPDEQHVAPPPAAVDSQQEPQSTHSTDATQEDHDSSQPASIDSDHDSDHRNHDDEVTLLECPSALRGKRVASRKFAFLKLELPTLEEQQEQDRQPTAYNLLEKIPNWYDSDAKQYRIANRINLNRSGVDNGLSELEVELSPDDDSYQVGDHFLVYPRNVNVLVQAYLDYLQLRPNAVIAPIQPPCVDSEPFASAYQHLRGLTVHEALSYCVDLGATPNPRFSRAILGDDKIVDYKAEVAMPRRTVLDMALEAQAATGRRVALEDVLYNLPMLQPRYYSIASSPLAGKHRLLLTYRPNRYMTSRGALREGTCTSYLSHLTPGSTVVGALKSNPSFRLPQDPQTPILMIAGGCGIAPIRSFLEERLVLHQQKQQHFGNAMLFLGFRDRDDVAYQELIEQCLDAGVLSHVHITTAQSASCNPATSTSNNNNNSRQHHHHADSISWQCGNVTDAFDAQGQRIWDHFEQGGHTYLCGGARNFGAAVEAQVVKVIQTHGNVKDVDEASAYLRNMIAQGRFAEDLAD